jgi:uncharacterized SAM-binding protein YcdF (DUF218 family)
LVVEEPPSGAAYLWLRPIDGQFRPGENPYDRAAAFYGEDNSRRILIFEPRPGRLVEIGILPSFETLTRSQLENRRVPREAVTVLGGPVRDGWDEARRLGPWLQQHSGARVVLLSSRFHSRCGHYLLKSVLGAEDATRVAVVAFPDLRYDETNWWKSRAGAKEFFSAWVGLLYAWWQGEARPEPPVWDPDDYERELQRGVGEAS